MSNSNEMEIRNPSAEVVAEDTAEKLQEQVGGGEEVVFVELTAPAGWKKKFIPKSTGTPRKNEIVFISPNGEEMRNKKQLDQYLKSHPGGPPSSEFDWGTGDTPRRSARISERKKAWEVVEDEPPKKKGKRSSLKKASAEKKNVKDEIEEVPEETAPLEEKKASADAEMKDAEDKTNKDELDTAEAAVEDGLQTKDVTEKCDNPEEEASGKTKLNDNKPLEDGDHHSNVAEKIEKEMKEHEDDEKGPQEKKEEKVYQKIDEREAAPDEKKDNSGEKPEGMEENHGKIESSTPLCGSEGGISSDIGNQGGHGDAKAVEAHTEVEEPNNVSVDDNLQSDDHPEDEVAKDGKTQDVESSGDRPVKSDEVLTQHKSSAVEC